MRLLGGTAGDGGEAALRAALMAATGGGGTDDELATLIAQHESEQREAQDRRAGETTPIGPVSGTIGNTNISPTFGG